MVVGVVCVVWLWCLCGGVVGGFDCVLVVVGMYVLLRCRYVFYVVVLFGEGEMLFVIGNVRCVVYLV